MRSPTAQTSAYFKSQGNSLALKGVDKPPLEDFQANTYQATHDLVGAVYCVSPDTIAKNTEVGYNTANSHEGDAGFKVLEPRNAINIHAIDTSQDKTTQVQYLLQQDPRRTRIDHNTRKKVPNHIARALLLSNPKTVTINLSQIQKLSEEMQVYFSPHLGDDVKKNIVEKKIGLPNHDPPIEETGYKMTFMIPSRLYLDGRNRFMDDQGLPDGLPVKIFNFCYPNFRHYRAQIVKNEFLQKGKAPPHCATDNYVELDKLYNQFATKGSYQDFHTLDSKTHQNLFKEKYLPELKEIFRINLQALIAESVRQKNSKNNPNLKLPFIVLAPTSFIVGYKKQDQEFIKEVIDDALKEVLKENIILVKQHISEVIEIGFNFPAPSSAQPSDPLEKQIKIHRVKTDMVEIAKTLNKEHDIEVPLPMMAHPTNPIGNGYYNVMRSSSTDEQLAKMSGNIADLVFARGVMKSRSSIKDLDSPVFKTLTKIEFVKTSKERDNYVYFQQSSSPDLRPARSAQSLTPQTSQHSFSIKKDNFTETNDKIDTAQIFGLAVENSVKDLSHFQNYKTDLFCAKLLYNIMSFAKDNQGVGNKERELRELINNNYPSAQVEQIIADAKKFSANFQKEMQNYGLMTGNQNPKKIVGARLHRMASQENIEQFFSNSLFKKQLTSLSSPNPAPAPRAGVRSAVGPGNSGRLPPR